jgi:hypothetical protein
MKTFSYILFIALLYSSCNRGDEIDTAASLSVKELSKLERLRLLPVDSIINVYDLSNDSIEYFPDLSAYTIKSLNFSCNLLDSIKPHYLPKGLEKLNLSHNQFFGDIFIKKTKDFALKELDMSYNEISTFRTTATLFRILLAHNDLGDLSFDFLTTHYLDISYNYNIGEVVQFNPHEIDTLISDGVANGKRLRFVLEGFVLPFKSKDIKKNVIIYSYDSLDTKVNN